MREKGPFPFFGFDFIEGEETSTTLSRGSGAQKVNGAVDGHFGATGQGEPSL
ncbi:hypothetical protein E1A91_A01G118700v1 [Gossypium mustelinum]|uniref:Uncharacterized protein n=1 Tax=Gossypium mustelinum TaxID=34275 RepID=A0A5D3ABT5_GOSMU|nr:hypothetical protein E1A91_A01G118700v1 [Gossypium mustelinum]